jgi:hypothetical protein
VEPEFPAELVPLVRKPRVIQPLNIFEDGPNLWRLPASVASEKGVKKVDLFVNTRDIADRLGNAIMQEFTWDVVLEWEGPGAKGRAFVVELVGDPMTTDVRVERAMAQVGTDDSTKTT